MSQSKQTIELIDLTNETTLHDKTITLDDSVSEKSIGNGDIHHNDYPPDPSPNSPAIIACDTPSFNGDLSNSSTSTMKELNPDSPISLTYDSAPSPQPVSPIPYSGSSSCSSPIQISTSQPVVSSTPSLISPNKRTPRRPIAKKAKLTPNAIAKRQEREEQKRLKQLQKDTDRLTREVNRANAANKALNNCVANIDPRILEIIGDPEEESIRTLFDESLIRYDLKQHAKVENCLNWTYKRTIIDDGKISVVFRDSSWMMIVMEGSTYLKKLLCYKSTPDSPQSIRSYLSHLCDQTDMDVILIVYNLSNHLKSERAKDAKNYRKSFKDRFENPTGSVEELQEQNNFASIGHMDLQDLRLMLEIELKRSHSNWKLHIEFYEKKLDIIQCFVRYTLSVAKLIVKQHQQSATGLDWAINMDKDRAVDPTKSSEDLTRLWITQLQQFSHITLPIAKSIAQEYPSPCALLDQYKSLTNEESENLLAELYIQRNLRRKIGPNISKRIYCFMTCDDPDVHIGLT